VERPFYTWEGDVLVLNILGTPNARKDGIGKVKGHQLCVSVKAVPRAGKATDYMVRFLAGEFGVAVRDIEVVTGRMKSTRCSGSSLPSGCQGLSGSGSCFSLSRKSKHPPVFLSLPSSATNRHTQHFDISPFVL